MQNEAVGNFEDLALAWKKYEDKILTPRLALHKRMVVLSEMKPTGNMLDFGTGIGEPGITAARTFESSRIYGVDVSEQMLLMANNRKLELAIDNFESSLKSVPILNFGSDFFSAAVSAFSLEYSKTIEEDLAEISRTVLNGSAMVVALWSEDARKNPFQWIIPTAIRSVTSATMLAHDVFFKFSKDKTLHEKMKRHAFEFEEEERMSGTYHYDSLAEFWHLKKLLSPAVNADLTQIDDPTRSQIIELINEKLSNWIKPNGRIELPFEAKLLKFRKNAA